MKLTILGGTGRTGREVVTQALAAQHDVTLLVRDPAKLGPLRERVTVIQGDTSDSQVVERAVAGADAVISTLGHTPESAEDVLSTAATNVVAAMRTSGVRRLVVLGNTAVRDPRDRPKLGQRLITGYLSVVKGGLMRDHAAQARIVADSGLDWTIVRAPRLSDGPRSGRQQVGLLGSDSGSMISRADVADFMLARAADREQLREMPLISGGAS